MGFMTGQKVYDNFTNGTGPQGLTESATMVRKLAEEYQGEGAAIRQLTAKMESIWRGGAAGAAQRGAGPLATEHELAAPHMGTAQDLNGRQAGSFTDARNAVKPVPPQPTSPDPWVAVNSPGDVTTYRQQVAEYNAANQHNVDVMTGYTAASSFNTKGMPQSYGAIAGDQAAITIGTPTSTPNSGPPHSAPKSDDPARTAGRGIAEPPSRGPAWVAPPSTASGPPSPIDSTPQHGGTPQQTTPGGFTPTPAGAVGPVPGFGGGAGSGPPASGPTNGPAPGTGFPPVGSGPYDGSGGRGPSGAGPGSGVDGRGPGGRMGGGQPHGPEGRGPSGRGVTGEPHGAGGRLGVGGVGGEPPAAGSRAGAAGRGGGMGGMPLGGGRSRDEDDLERYAPEFLQEDDPEALFGTDEMTAPPVIGEDFDRPDPPTAG
jgi:hypothetical protein